MITGEQVKAAVQLVPGTEPSDEVAALLVAHARDRLAHYKAPKSIDFHAELRAVIRAKCSNDEIPAGLLSKIELCFGEDFDGDGHIG